MSEDDPESTGPKSADLQDNVSLDEAVAEAARASMPKSLQGSLTPAQVIAQARAQSEQEVALQHKQNTLWRRFLFWSVWGLVVGIAVLSGVLIVVYLRIAGADSSPAVLSTWFGATVVQVVGLLLVITRHLFPSSTTK
jgi:hypothetical protein